MYLLGYVLALFWDMGVVGRLLAISPFTRFLCREKEGPSETHLHIYTQAISKAQVQCTPPKFYIASVNFGK